MPKYLRHILILIGGFKSHKDNGKFIIDDYFHVFIIFDHEKPASDSYEYRIDFENKKLIKDIVISHVDYIAYFLL